MSERVRFIMRLLEGERMVDLCEEFGISRKTGYKFWERYEKYGFLGLEDQGRAPLKIPHKTNERLERLILDLRQMRPSWGPKKLRARLQLLNPGLEFPAASTIGEILKRNGHIEARRRRKKANFHPSAERTKSLAPNEVWCVDFKGQFRLGNGQYCYPLTISDHFSRLIILCEALESTQSGPTFEAFHKAFSEFGLPKVILSDNGVPFSSAGLGGLSQLSAWWMRLGISPERIEPGHPEQNGRHERMHLTLKKETTRPAAKNIFQQQEVFDDFRQRFNHERPHESLGMKVPDELYRPSSEKLPPSLPDPDYSLCDEVRVVSADGRIQVPSTSERCFIGRALSGQPIGLRQLDKTTWNVRFVHTSMGFIVPGPRGPTLTVDNPLTPEEET